MWVKYFFELRIAVWDILGSLKGISKCPTISESKCDLLSEVLSARFMHCEGFLSFCNQKVMHGDIWAPVTILFPTTCPSQFWNKGIFLDAGDFIRFVHAYSYHKYKKTLSNRNDLGARIIHVTANGRMSILACVY